MQSSIPTYHAPNYPTSTTAPFTAVASVTTTTSTDAIASAAITRATTTTTTTTHTESINNTPTILPVTTTTTTTTPVLTNNNDTNVAITTFGQNIIRDSVTATQITKRTQVKNACTNCQKACKKCDDSRPCPRCVKYGVANTCVSSVRKERRKGIKRGPYKKRQKSSDYSTNSSESPNKPNAPNTTTALADNNTSNHVFTASFPSQLSQYTQAAAAAAAAAYDSYTTYACVLPILSAVYPHQEVVNALNNAVHGNNNKNAEIGSAVSTNNENQRDSDNNTSTQTSYLPTTVSEADSQQATTAASTETGLDDDKSKFDRLTELCSAALQAKNHEKKDESNDVNHEIKVASTVDKEEVC